MPGQPTTDLQSAQPTDASSPASGMLEMPERLRDAFENLIVGCQILDRQLRYIYINTHAALHGRRQKEELLGRRMIDVYPGIESTLVYERIQHCLSTGASERLDNQFNYPDGSVGIFALSLQAIPEGILIASVDVTSERELASRLLQSQKMEAVGRLAGGVAHDFNNLLTVIKGHCDLLQAGCAPAQQLDSINAIRSAGQRAARLTRQLLSLSRHSQVNIESVDLNLQLRKSQDFMQSLLGASIQLQLRPHDRLPLVKIDSAQFEQTLMNLVLNARDAMPSGGTLTITTAPYELGADDQANYPNNNHDIRIPEMKPGNYVYFRVSDNGVGMSAETQSRIFEPFFTTKEVGRGTGLGLSVVHGAVQRAEGYIAVRSEPGLGSSFHIFYPAVAGPAPSTTEAIVEEEEDMAHVARIALVEDEDSVRKIVRLSLEKHNYQVIEFNSADTALRSIQPDMTIDLLITDVVMPHMRGPELAQILLRSHANMRVLYMSGYADESMGLRDAMRSCDNFLQKPFSPVDLLHRVQHLLGTSTSSTSQ